MSVAIREPLYIEQALNGLIIYAEEIAQNAWKNPLKIREVVEEMSAYWNLQEKKDWRHNFDNRLMLTYYDQKPETITEEEKMKTIHGLTCYMEEMMRTHGKEETERIQAIQKLITEMDNQWNLPSEQMVSVHEKVEGIIKNL